MTTKYLSEDYSKDKIAKKYVYTAFKESKVNYYVLQEVDEDGFTLKEIMFQSNSPIYNKYKKEIEESKIRTLVGFRRKEVKL